MTKAQRRLLAAAIRHDPSSEVILVGRAAVDMPGGGIEPGAVQRAELERGQRLLRFDEASLLDKKTITFVAHTSSSEQPVSWSSAWTN